MALSTYEELKTTIADWLARDDLTSKIPDFITLFEAHLARRLKIRLQETSTTISTSSGSGSLPSDFLGERYVTFNGESGGRLEYAEPSWFRAAYPTAETGLPVYYTIEGGSIIIRPVDDTGLTLGYFAKDTAAETTLDSIFTNYPDAYLFGSLVESQSYVQDVEKVIAWKLRRDEVLDEIEKKFFREREGLVIRPEGAIV